MASPGVAEAGLFPALVIYLTYWFPARYLARILATLSLAIPISLAVVQIELMRRLGHSSPAAALLYQHAADDRDADIARALDAMLGAATDASDEPPGRDE